MQKPTLRNFGLVLMAACSLMAVFAVGAQAENLSDGGKAGNFLILESSALVAGAELTGTLLDSVKLAPSKNFYILCSSGDITGKGLSATEILFTILLLGCKTFNDLTKAELLACPILGVPSKEEITFTGIGKAKLHEGALFIFFDTEKEKPFEEIKFGEECILGTKVKLAGTLAALVDNGNSAVDHLLIFSEPIQKLLGGKILFGTAEQFLIGEAHVHLTGTHTNCAWAVD